MKKVLICLFALIMSISMFTAVAIAETSPQPQWVGCYNNYGVETTENGWKIVYDGYYTAALNDDYVQLNVDILSLKESIYGESGATQEGLMNFALLNTPSVSPTWGNDYEGLYMHVRNIGGKLYFKLYIKSSKVANGYAGLFEQTTDINVTEVEKIVLQKETEGYSFFVNDVEFAHDNLATVPHGAMCDANGKTYFGYASFNNPDDANRQFEFTGIVNERPVAPTPDPEPDPEPTTPQWVGCFDNFGVETTENGWKIVYDGYYTAALNDDYVQLNVDIISLKESIYGESGATQEGLMNFALLNTPSVSPTWGNDYEGLYMHVRNIGGKLYFKLYIKSSKVANGYADLFEQTTDINVTEVEKIVLQKETEGYSFFVNETEFAHDNLATVPHGAMCDANGKTYFGYASFNNPDDADRQFEFTGIVNERPVAPTPDPEPDPEPETTYASYLSQDTWGGTYGQFGVTEKWNGLDIVYDGWYTKALSPDYIEVNFAFINLLESVASASGYSQEAIFDFAFIDKQYTAPNWQRSSANGVYLMMRNIEGKLYIQASIKTAESDATVFFNEVTDISVTEVSKLVFKKNGTGFTVSVNGVEIGAEATAQLSVADVCDDNGYTFFAMESFSAGGSGADADRRMISLSYIAEKEGQVPDPSIIPPEQIEEGEEDYDAPVGMGLTAKKYDGTVTQLDNGVLISGNSVLYTPLTSQSVEITALIKGLEEGKMLRVGLDGTQKIYALTEDPAVYLYVKNEGGIKISADGTTWMEVTVQLNETIKIAFAVKEEFISIYFNGDEVKTQVTQGNIIGKFGTFLTFAMTEGTSVELTSVKNRMLDIDLSATENWNNPFGGVVSGDPTEVFAHATYKTPLDNDFVKIDFKVKGLIDTTICTSYITFALLMENSICDPVNPSETGIYVWIRNFCGKLQFKVAARTEFMGLIESHGWTDVDISLQDDVSLIFVKDVEKGNYRILLNNFEIVGGKLDEILTIDSSDRNDRTWLGIGCWHDNTATDLSVGETRSVFVYSVDNVYDEDDMPESIIQVGEIEEIPDLGGDSGDNSENTNSSSQSNNNGGGCMASYTYANIFAVALIACALIVSRRKLQKD